MGTRGALLIRSSGRDIVQYVHSDSYPGGWADGVVNWLARADVPNEPSREALLTAWHRGTLADVPPPQPGPTGLERLRDGIGFVRVLADGDEVAYRRLRDTQGSPGAILDAGEVIDVGVEWLRDGLFCEYAYCINLDEDLFEVYEGFQSEPFTVEEGGRYAAPDAANGWIPKYEGQCFYYPVRLVATFPLDDIPSDWAAVAFLPEDDDG